MKLFILVILVFFLSGVIYSTQVIPLPDINKPSIIKIEQDKMYIAEEYSVKVVSLKTFKIERIFGRQGAGPGEFNWIISDMIILPEKVFINSNTKASWFLKDGKLLKEHRCKNRTSFIPLENKNIFTFINSNLYYQKDNRAFITYSLFDAHFKKIKDLYKTEYYLELIHTSPQINKNVRMYYVHHFNGLDYDVSAQRIFIADSRKGFFIKVFDFEGRELYTINKGWERITIPNSYNEDKFKNQEDFAREKGFWNLIKNCKFVYDKYFPPILSFKIAGSKIYVATYKKINNRTEFLILDLKGNELKKTYLPVNTSQELDFSPEKLINYTVYNKRLYQLIENQQKEEWELHIFDIKPSD